MLRRQVRLVRAQHDRDIDSKRSEVRQPEQCNTLVAVVVGVNEENHIRFPDLARQVVPLLRYGRGVDDSGCGDIFRGSNRRGDGNLGEDRLDLVRDKDTLHQRGDEAGLASAFVAADADPD
jgi:hypothetical protein